MHDTTWIITDNATDETVIGDAYAVEDTVRGWFPEPPTEVIYVLDLLFEGLRCGTVADEHETYLGLKVGSLP